MTCRVPVAVMRQLTAAQERNIYIHPNPLAREIFWQRIERLGRRIKQRVSSSWYGLDFGGGSGALVRFWGEWGGRVDVVDLDAGDAARLATYYHATNVLVLERSIEHHRQDPPYDFVVAADVLEHFPELSFPVQHIQRLLKPGGLLFISIPTENFLYELGRKIVRKSKPADHFHASHTIIAFLEAAGLTLLQREKVPRLAWVDIPLFEVCVFRKS